jgi:hypothetical protein
MERKFEDDVAVLVMGNILQIDQNENKDIHVGEYYLFVQFAYPRELIL